MNETTSASGLTTAVEGRAVVPLESVLVSIDIEEDVAYVAYEAESGIRSATDMPKRAPRGDGRTRHPVYIGARLHRLRMPWLLTGVARRPTFETKATASALSGLSSAPLRWAFHMRGRDAMSPT